MEANASWSCSSRARSCVCMFLVANQDGSGTFTFLILFAALFPDRDCAKPTIPSSFAKLAFTDFVNRSHHLFLRQIQLQ